MNIHTLDIRYSSLRTIGAAIAFGLTILASSTVLAQETAKNLQVVGTTPALKPANTTVGHFLESAINVGLHPGAPAGGISIIVTSNDPGHLLLSTTPNGAGMASITLKVREGITLSPEFYAYGLADSGTATYTATAPGFNPGTGTVTLGPSGVIMSAKSRSGATTVMTTTRAKGTQVTVGTVLLDASLNFVSQQSVAGGQVVKVNLNSSNKAVGIITDSPLAIEPGSNTATTLFQPVAPGNTNLALVMPDGFKMPTQGTAMNAVVRVPGIGLADEPTIGQNLQTSVSFSLGEAAPDSGLEVTVVSKDPSKLILSNSALEIGTSSIKVMVPPNGTGGSFFLQALDKTGVVGYSVSAPGYNTRVGEALLASSGVVIAGISFPETGGPADPGFLASISSTNNMPLFICTAFLDPVSHRAADVRVQPVRAGYSVTAHLVSSDPKVGTVVPSVTLNAGQGIFSTPFNPLTEGKTVITIDIPPGFDKPANATYMRATVGK